VVPHCAQEREEAIQTRLKGLTRRRKLAERVSAVVFFAGGALSVAPAKGLVIVVNRLDFTESAN
jgi:hypothetical protein